MKRLFKVFAVIAALAAVGPRWGFAATRIEGGTLLDSTGLAYSTSSAGLNTDGLNTLSMQATYSTTTFPTATIVDGRKSTMTITVSDNNALVAAKAAVRLTIINPSSTTWVGTILTLNGIAFREGVGKEWRSITTATGTAINLAAAIDASDYFEAVAVSTVVFATATYNGVAPNSWTAATSAPTVISTSAPLFSGGLENARLYINGVSLIQGTDWTRGATSALTAKAISDTIMARSALTSIIVSTYTSGGIIFATSTLVGVNAYETFTSTSGALRLAGSATANTATFSNGLASDIASSVFNENNHRLTLGLPVLYTTSAGTAPQNLVAGTTYFVVPTDRNNFKLASSQANALANTTLTVSTFTGAGTFVLTPLAISASPANLGFKFQVSNDNTNWADLAVSSVTLTATSNSTSFWDLGTPAYRWIRAFFVGPAQGGYAITITANGRQN